MNFAFSEEQEELRRITRQFLESKSPESEVRRLMDTDEGYDPAVWSQMANELGLRNVAFEVDDLTSTVDRLVAEGYPLVGGIGEYEGVWRMAYIRGPEGIIVSLAERVG